MTFVLGAAYIVLVLLLILFTKLHDGDMNVGSLLFCLFVAAVPVVIIISLVYVIAFTIEKRKFFQSKFFKKVLF